MPYIKLLKNIKTDAAELELREKIKSSHILNGNLLSIRYTWSLLVIV